MRPDEFAPSLDLILELSDLCAAFATKQPVSSILSHFSSLSPSPILIHEHGLPQLAPFLGRDFRGRDGVTAYFAAVSACLTYANMEFSNYVVDPVSRKVSVRGAAVFTWTSTGQSWDEVFTYVLAFDDELKVDKYEIWADSGAAYLASRGEL
ncbi:hypothetical protein B0T22DRAFT_486173 [Podospora appendiculata]|uniref:SnoaL-like domain-containing protein n=1 Tax=Podospora appendiculata TaxID=314037 RepID=A0AAE0XFE9_9PEZI|nr:hypothetical protein B0T22DRAFT_486173 [Podospora appendiculata]